MTVKLTKKEKSLYVKVWVATLLQEVDCQAFEQLEEFLTQDDLTAIQVQVNLLGSKLMGKNTTNQGSALGILQDLFPVKFPK